MCFFVCQHSKISAISVRFVVIGPKRCFFVKKCKKGLLFDSMKMHQVYWRLSRGQIVKLHLHLNKLQYCCPRPRPQGYCDDTIVKLRRHAGAIVSNHPSSVWQLRIDINQNRLCWIELKYVGGTVLKCIPGSNCQNTHTLTYTLIHLKKKFRKILNEIVTLPELHCNLN